MIKYFDGGLGTMLRLKAGQLPEGLNLTDPERVFAIHEAYRNAGADIISTNTFGANRLKYDNVAEIVKAGVVLAGKTGKKVALALGPTGKLLKPVGELDFEDCVDIYAEAIRAGRDGADLVLFETMGDLYEIKAAVLAAKENCDLPIIVSMIFDEKETLLTGADVKTACATVEALGVSAIGLNCGTGPEQMLSLLRQLREYASVPILVMPNAGLPQVTDGETTYMPPEEYAEWMGKIAKMGVSYLGGCCGTTPAHISAVIAATKPIPDSIPTPKTHTLVTSYSACVELGEKSVVIGERLNPTGKKALKEALRNRDMAYILREGIQQKDAGAHILDVNMGLPEIDEPRMLSDAVQGLQGVLNLPLQIDSSNEAALEKALRIYNGKALINSVNGKQESMEKIFPLVKKYGGVLVCLCLDEDGIPATAEGRIRIAEKIVARAEAYGIGRKDLVLDALTMTVSTDTQNAIETLKAVEYFRHQMGIHTVLGVSNVSFGLPNREAVNTAFYTLALQKGLSAGIINPCSKTMMNAYYAFHALSGLDENCADYIRSAVAVSEAPAAVNFSLREAIVKGVRDESGKQAGLLLRNTEPLRVISEHIIPALDEVGEGFARGKLFLPQLLMSAESAKRAFDEIKTHLTATGTQGEKGETVILATVEGDIHDIGKNIVKVLLSNYGFDVLDLGKDVKCETVLAEVLRTKAGLVGLSALMTTTVANMEKTIRLIHENTSAKVVVGGAVLTPEYAKAIGADWYARDAMETVRIAQEFFGQS